MATGSHSRTGGEGPPLLRVPEGPPLLHVPLPRNDAGAPPIQEDRANNAELPSTASLSIPQPRLEGFGDDQPMINLAPLSDALVDLITQSGTYVDTGVQIRRDGGLNPESSVGINSLQDLEKVRTLGKGASAVVQLVKHKVTGSLFALKEISMSIEEPIRGQIRQELQINQKQRENVVNCYQSFFLDGQISIVLEYMDGGSLADVVAQKRKLSEPYLAEVARQALHALVMLHKDHIIHRDIKPSNILLNQKGEVKVADFGVSKEMDGTMAVGNTFVGTCTYMSPERIRGDAYSYNSDTWGVGLTVLECAIGHFPYLPPKGKKWDFFALMNTVLLQPTPQAPAEEFSAEFRSFIADCLQKDPALRPTAADALEHPFITLHKDKRVNIGDLCRK